MRTISGVALSLSLLVPGVSFSQSQVAPDEPAATAQRDTQAVALLTNAVAALGGAGNIAAVHDCSASGTFTASGETWLRFRSFVWKNAGGQYAYEVTAADGTRSVDRSGHGRPSLELQGIKRPRRDHAPSSAAPAHLAALRLVELLQNPQFDVVLDGVGVLNGASVFKVKTQYNLNAVEASLTQQEWYLDQNFLPLRIEYQVGDNSNAANLTKMSADLASYAPVSGVLVPMQITFSMNGKVGATATISQIGFNSGIGSSTFD